MAHRDSTPGDDRGNDPSGERADGERRRGAPPLEHLRCDQPQQRPPPDGRRRKRQLAPRELERLPPNRDRDRRDEEERERDDGPPVPPAAAAALVLLYRRGFRAEAVAIAAVALGYLVYNASRTPTTGKRRAEAAR